MGIYICVNLRRATQWESECIKFAAFVRIPANLSTFAAFSFLVQEIKWK